MASTIPPDSAPAPEQPGKPRRRRGDRASEEAVMTLTRPIANWQAKIAWACTMWGLIPVAGLPLGIIGLVLGYLGYRRVRRRPGDLGIRHAVGGMIMGAAEILVNVVGLGCIVKGIIELSG